MKNTIISFLVLGFSAFVLFSFKNSTSTRYGGTASVSVRVGPQSMPNCMYFDDRIKEGQIRIIEASTSCYHSSSSAAKENLKRDIESQIKCYEKATTSIDYDIDTCD